MRQRGRCRRGRGLQEPGSSLARSSGQTSAPRMPALAGTAALRLDPRDRESGQRAPTGKISLPRTELNKAVYAQGVLNREQQLRHQVVGAVVEQGLITCHLKKWVSSASITLSGKKGRRLQQIRLAQEEKAAMEVEVPSEPARTQAHSTNGKRGQNPFPQPQYVDMEDLEDES
ncbi:hypothetical protein TREES_T100000090 [Tupaia chinensis]|uniref:Uncharacterized protein n=1 Tax=Tupaia chinensis TaxID=246437 RepID=L9L9I9_TUPCH|nr:hypothetical protein TREES_T100000090 [Tupaia chinensis]